ncbi:ABC transporter permease subunit [Tersicoccus sp. MR15.9]|uniref:ABC transporter permease subunit n=1 Tax=Tersicoccus mangrovi TaxID=3121635 RepID=UPI002FE53EBD
MTTGVSRVGRSATGRRALPLFAVAMESTWRSLVGWCVGLTATLCLYLPLFPSIGGGQQMQQLISSLPRELVRTLNYDQIGTGPGYAQSTFFGLMGFVLTTIAVITWGAAAVGGDEESGQLELTLAHGVTRSQVVLERFAALVVRVVVMVLVVFVVVLALNEPSQLGLDTGHLAGMCLEFGLLTLLTGSVALAAGAVTGRRVWGIGAGTAVAVLGYVFNALGNQSEDLQGLHAFSPYHAVFGPNPLTAGADGGVVLAFVVAIAVIVALAVGIFSRRDVGR